MAHITLKLDKAGQQPVCVCVWEEQAVTAKQQGRMMMLLLLQRKMFWRCTFCHISGYISNTGRGGEGRGSVAGDVVVSGCGHSLRASREPQPASERAGESGPNTTHMHMRIGTLTLTYICMYICDALVFVV